MLNANGVASEANTNERRVICIHALNKKSARPRKRTGGIFSSEVVRPNSSGCNFISLRKSVTSRDSDLVRRLTGWRTTITAPATTAATTPERFRHSCALLLIDGSVVVLIKLLHAVLGLLRQV